jgi:hypothetical protein
VMVCHLAEPKGSVGVMRKFSRFQHAGQSVRC